MLDLDLGVGASGIDVAIALREKNSKIGIVFLTTYKDPRLINSNMPSLPEGAIFLNKLEMNSTAKIAIQISLAIVKPLAKRALPWVRRGWNAASLHRTHFLPFPDHQMHKTAQEKCHSVQ